MNIYLEIFGYIGTALVLTSMLMTSVVKLRAFNAVGSLVSMVYAYLSGTWPVVILNLSLLVINTIQLIRLSRAKVSLSCIPVPAQDRCLQHFLSCYREDIHQYFPTFAGVPEDCKVFMVCQEAEPVGVFVARQEADALHVALDYTTPKYRDCSVASFLFPQLKAQGAGRIVTDSHHSYHLRYLKKMGFQPQDGKLVKIL